MSLATRSFPVADIWRSEFQAASSPTLFSEAIRSLRPRSRAAAEIAFDRVLSEASQRGSTNVCRRLCAAPGTGHRCNPASRPLFPKVSIPLVRDRLPWVTGLASYLSETPFICRQLTCFSSPLLLEGNHRRCTRWPAANFPAVSDVFAAPTFLRSLVVRQPSPVLIQQTNMQGSVSKTSWVTL